MRRRFEGKVVLAVGAGAKKDDLSIGGATAISFAREGATVMVVDVRADAAAETRQLITAEGGTCIAETGDASDPDVISRLVHRCRSELGSINVLYNNIGIMAFGAATELAVEDWDHVMAVNARSPFLASKAVLPDMIAGGGGAIVNVSSIAATRWTGARYLPYSASKAAIIGFTRALALEYAVHRIRVNCVVPGYVDSPMMRSGLEHRLGLDAVEQEVARRHAASPLGRLANGWDIANAVLFLASDEASYITGVSLPVDGGASLDATL
jgi:NAD(P)-dependent dehydrogenase (short-subunit alcohol dehydrogenase family)